MTNPHTKPILDLVRNNPHQHSYQSVAGRFNMPAENVRNIARVHNVQGLFYKARGQRGKIGVEAPSQGDSQMAEPTKAQLDALLAECQEHGIDVNDVKHFWHKSRKISMFVVAQNRPTYETVRDELIKEMRKHSPKYPRITYRKPRDGHMLVLDPADVHIGKLAVKTETGQHYDMETAVKMVHEGCEGILRHASGFPLERIMLVVGNDVLHRDNPQNTTTSGTRQDTDGMWHEAFIAARQMYVTLIERLMKVAPVHVVFNPANHDYQSGFMLCDALYCWFNTAKSVTFDREIIHRKYTQYGKNLIVTTHGDGAKFGDMPLLMASERPQMWADTVHRYAYVHHLHHRQKHQFLAHKDFPGITLEIMRSPSASDQYHYKNGYVGAPKAIEGAVHHPEKGKVAHLTHIF